MSRFVCLITLLVLLGPRAEADNPPASSDDLTRELMRFSGNIHQFNNLFPQEKVYLEFDNTAYFQGEVIWFKAFVTHATTLKRAPSKVLYVDLISPTGQLIDQQKLKIVAGQCDGAFVMYDPATEQSREKKGIVEYPSGFYEIRAYTQNMLDFSHDAIFSRIIPVYTKPKRAGDFENTTVLTERSKISPTVDLRDETDEGDRRINISFFPEGGDLIAGLPCNVAFKATGADGFAIDGAIVLNDGADTVCTVHDGMGLFTIIPKGSETVHFITKEGKRKRFTLPKALKSGYSMVASPCTDSLIEVSITRTPDLAAEPSALAVTCRGELVYFKIIENGDSSHEIDCADWPIGVCRLTLYNKEGKILSSRSIFHNNSAFKSPTITFSTDSISRQPFSKEIINLKLTDKDGKPLRDRFCLSVRDADDYGNGLTDNLKSNLLLSSDLKGYIHDPDWYIQENDPEHRTALNLLTLVQGWERYEWKYMTGIETFTERHRIEDSLTMNGWVLSYTRRKPVADIDVYASVIPQDKTKFETFKYHTDSTGYFGFDLRDFYGKARMQIHLMSNKRNGDSQYETSTRIKFERSDRPEPKTIRKQETDLTHNPKGKSEPEPDFTDDGLPLVIKQDLGIVLDDVDITEKRQYIDYDTYTSWNVAKDAEMELDLGEYTTDVQGYLLEKGVRLFDNKDPIPHYFYVHNDHTVLDYLPFGGNVELGEEPEKTMNMTDAKMIDMMDVKSIIIFDRPMYPLKMVEFTPLLVEYCNKRINLQWSWWVDTCMTRFYLVDILMKNEDELLAKRDIINLSRRNTTVEGFSVPVEFYSPQYPEGAIPGEIDTRRTLYWNANVITDDDGRARVEFYNNSYTVHFTVSGAGITASGIPYVLNQNW